MVCPTKQITPTFVIHLRGQRPFGLRPAQRLQMSAPKPKIGQSLKLTVSCEQKRESKTLTCSIDQLRCTNEQA